ncbi:hypothetical protein EVAR_99732_1 [Eumeta japonica]|uniref:Uncharacterized protein n=1 Tax=Eumeta variegata TaxID=151549 RepID=A0A4C1Z2G3_EUMVA|nr:hypothetical protein EVAR_99732_1 [Eumeta japonica]
MQADREKVVPHAHGHSQPQRSLVRCRQEEIGFLRKGKGAHRNFSGRNMRCDEGGNGPSKLTHVTKRNSGSCYFTSVFCESEVSLRYHTLTELKSTRSWVDPSYFHVAAQLAIECLPHSMF